MSKKRIILLAVIALGLLLGLYSLLHKPPASVKYSHVATNFQSPWVDKNSIYFFTGSNFAKYNFQSNATEKISDYLYLKNNVSSFNWSSKGVLFFSDGQQQDDYLNLAASNFGADLAQPAWWFYDFNTQKLNLLGFSGASLCREMVQADNGFLCLKPHAGSARQTDIYLYHPAKQPEPIYSSQNLLSNLSCVLGKCFYVEQTLGETKNLKGIDLLSKSSSVIFSGGQDLKYSATSGSKLLVLDGEINSEEGDKEGAAPVIKQRLLLVDNGKVVSSKKLKKPDGLVLSANGILFYFSQDGSILQEANDKLVEIQDKTALPGLPQLMFTLANNPVFIDSKGRYYSSSGSPTILMPANKFSAISVPGAKSYIDNYIDGGNKVYFYNPGLDFKTNAEQVGSFIKSVGYDPNQFNFDWVIKVNQNSVPLNPSIGIIN